MRIDNYELPNDHGWVYTSTVPQGWQCPKCGNIYAPHVSECANCNTKYAVSPWTVQPWKEWDYYGSTANTGDVQWTWTVNDNGEVIVNTNGEEEDNEENVDNN